jgi:hypothetical protein
LKATCIRADVPFLQFQAHYATADKLALRAQTISAALRSISLRITTKWP